MRLREHITQVLSARRNTQAQGQPRSGYIVFSGPYLSNSAGVNCLHRLCDELNRYGYPSFTTGGDVAAPHLNAPIIDEESAAMLCGGGFVAIYPETVSGNPLNARTIIRWVLNRPGLLGGDKVYDDSELVFSYSDVFSPYINNTIVGKLHMPTIDDSLFYCYDADLSKRSLECYYVGKSTWKDGFVDPLQAFEINRQAPNKKELGKLFRSAKALYCFDNSTVLVYEALFCGCPVIVIPDGTHSKEDFAVLELGADDIAWGLDEFTGTAVDIARLKTRYDLVQAEFSRQFEQMVELSQAQTGEAIDWDTIARQERSWWQQPGANFVKRCRETLRWGRKIERAVRRWRKHQEESLRIWRGRRKLSRLDASAFFCDDGSLSNRRLECYLSDPRRTQIAGFDTRDAFAIVPTTSASQLSTLFRSARRFYSFDRNDPLVPHALACGCPVTVIASGEPVRHVLPALRDPRAANTQVTLDRKSSIAAA